MATGGSDPSPTHPVVSVSASREGVCVELYGPRRAFVLSPEAARCLAAQLTVEAFAAVGLYGAERPPAAKQP